MRLSLAALSLSLLSYSIQARADATPEQIVAAMSGVEQAPNAEQIRSWSERSIPTLVSIAEDAQRPEFVRARAAAAIRTFAPTPDARAALERLANGSAPHPLVLRAALDGLCIGWGELTIAQRFLRSLASDHREAAAWAIARSGRTEARAILVQAREGERDPAIHATLESALRELERAITARNAGPNASASIARSAVVPGTVTSAPRARRTRARR